MFECRVYAHAQYKLGNDHYIGGTKGAIESLLSEGASGGHRLPICSVYKLSSCPSLAIIRQLYKYDAHGNPTKTQTTIEFTIATISGASDAAELSMEDAIAQEQDAIDHMNPAPFPSERIQGAISISDAAVNTTKSVSETWGPLLQKIEIFTSLVDTISEVYDVELTNSVVID
jgi:hypothetical protein